MCLCENLLRVQKGEVKGIGAKSIEKIAEFLETGKMQALVSFVQSVPSTHVMRYFLFEAFTLRRSKIYLKLPYCRIEQAALISSLLLSLHGNRLLFRRVLHAGGQARRCSCVVSLGRDEWSCLSSPALFHVHTVKESVIQCAHSCALCSESAAVIFGSR